jgi:hypothetical protein
MTNMNQLTRKEVERIDQKALFDLLKSSAQGLSPKEAFECAC